MRLQHQKDLMGCGIACLANLLNQDYDLIKKNFEKDFYSIKRGVAVTDIVSYLDRHELKYKSKFFKRNTKDKNKIKEAKKFSKIEGSITLIAKNDKYPVGHYLLRTKNEWIDPWIGYPSIDNVRVGTRKTLPGDPWYVIYPILN